MMRIAIDVMGGDRGPSVVVEGAVLAAREYDIEIALVGQREAVEREIAHHSIQSLSIQLVPASQTVAMDETPTSTLRKKDSSMRVAFDMMKKGEVCAVVSAGNSGAMLATGMFVMRTLPRVDRPAILVVIPSSKGGTVLIDAGANTDCRSHHLVQFGLMGSVYSERVLGLSCPRVGILSNGEEEGKGTERTREASEQIRSSGVNCIGYVEGRDITNGRVDVVVCDGFTGNISLKSMEGLAGFIMNIFQEAFRQSILSRLGYLLCRRSLRNAYRRLDYAEYGGAPLMGLDGVAIVAHGGSSPKAIKNAIRVAKETVSQDVNRHIVDMMEGLKKGDGDRKEPIAMPNLVTDNVQSLFLGQENPNKK